jgi:spoIIIJ-associated protein
MKYKVQIVERDPAELNGYDEQDEPTLVLDIRGSDLNMLIGRRGETLDSLQYLIRLLVAKELGHYVHIVLDVEGYKAHRAQMLKQLALRMAERVATTHKPAALEPMPANERRIVHLALRDHAQVRTESVGLGENRKVTIIPQSYKR